MEVGCLLFKAKGDVQECRWRVVMTRRWWLRGVMMRTAILVNLLSHVNRHGVINRYVSNSYEPQNYIEYGTSYTANTNYILIIRTNTKMVQDSLDEQRFAGTFLGQRFAGTFLGQRCVNILLQIQN